MTNKTTGRKTGRINVKKLKGDPKELTAKEQKKVKGGGLASSAATKPNDGLWSNHNETLVHDIVR
jgi:hypothetical protein